MSSAASEEKSYLTLSAVVFFGYRRDGSDVVTEMMRCFHVGCVPSHTTDRDIEAEEKRIQKDNSFLMTKVLYWAEVPRKTARNADNLICEALEKSDIKLINVTSHGLVCPSNLFWNSAKNEVIKRFVSFCEQYDMEPKKVDFKKAMYEVNMKGRPTLFVSGHHSLTHQMLMDLLNGHGGVSAMGKGKTTSKTSRKEEATRKAESVVPRETYQRNYYVNVEDET